MVDIVDIPAILTGEVGCAQCVKTFPNAKLLQQHQQTFHSDKSFVCEICGKGFRFRSNLAEHRSVHTALKPYVCKFCGKSSRLKGNLTKHILKHHKREQSDQIGKDDIIVKKAHEPMDYMEKQVLALSQGNTMDTSVSMLPKEETNDQERSILISLGLDYNTSIDLRSTDSPDEASASPENGSPSDYKQEYMDSEQSYGSPLPSSTVGGETSLAALIASVNSPPPQQKQINNPPPATTPVSSISNSIMSHNKTKCDICGKNFRKREQMAMHMTINHGFPPPESTTSSEGGKTTSEAETNDVDWVQTELAQMRNIVNEVKMQNANNAKIEQLLTGMDSRIGRLEKQVEMALNSIYTLVQLQTGMNSSVTRFREDACEQLRSVRALLKDGAENASS